MFLLPSCYGAKVCPNERDWHTSGYDFSVEQAAARQGVVQRLSQKTLAEWSAEPSWAGGWSPYVSVCVRWQNGSKFYYKAGDIAKVSRRSRVFYDVKPLERNNLLKAYEKNKAFLSEPIVPRTLLVRWGCPLVSLQA
jgi:hypothetical protein